MVESTEGNKIIEELCVELARLEYDLQAVLARAAGTKNRIVDEWLLHKPLKTYGRPAVTLSKPLSINQVIDMMESETKHISFCLECSKRIEERIKSMGSNE